MNMRVHTITFWLLSFAIHALGVAQGSSEGSPIKAGFNDIPGEAVYVHHNSSLLFAGETLYYRIYCMNTTVKKPSRLSKMAYIALVGIDGLEVFRHKIQLDDGLGQGDFFVPASVPTGSYKLLAYTQWMKNGRGTPVFESDIVLINPYLNTVARYRELPLPDSLATDSMGTRPVTPSLPENNPVTFNNLQLTFSLDKQVYQKRELVTLELTADNAAVPGGAYSISVKRIPELTQPDSGHAPLIPVIGNTIERVGSGTMVLPELRGELISGTISTNEEGLPLANIPLAVSFVGDEFVFDMARTDGDGKFYFNISHNYAEDSGIFQVVSPDAAAFDIRIETHTLPVPASETFYKFTMNADLAKEIRDRSIRNQIENAYEEVKADTLVQPEESIPFYRDFQLQYHLDDYTRFNTIEETLVEIVDHVWVTKGPAGAIRYQVRPFDGYLDGIGIAPMVFMDGLFIQNHRDIAGFPARRIKNIFISRDRFQVGAHVFQGILAFETFSSDFSETFYRDFLRREAMFKPQPHKSYYFEQYGSGEEKGRIPDFREQLYWDPDLGISGETENVRWYTSDLGGTYEIRIEGYATNGRPVSLTTYFSVE
jgi:hypothetical protein